MQISDTLSIISIGLSIISPLCFLLYKKFEDKSTKIQNVSDDRLDDLEETQKQLKTTQEQLKDELNDLKVAREADKGKSETIYQLLLRVEDRMKECDGE